MSDDLLIKAEEADADEDEIASTASSSYTICDRRYICFWAINRLLKMTGG
jgi:hypothetical protein